MSGYAFLDCGNGRRLEDLGGVVVERPAPAAHFPPGLDAAAWQRAALAFSHEAGWRGAAPDAWTLDVDGVRLRLRPGAAGQVGVFPEHAGVASAVVGLLGDALAGATVLNLFAHTGLATLRLAAAGAAEVAHVDASAAAVRAARANAVLSGLEDARIRWLVDDAAGFMRREARRGRRYGAVLADPPAYGRSGKHEWKLERDLPALLELAASLLAGAGRLLCLTCHSEGLEGGGLAALVGGVFPGWTVRAERLALRSGFGGRDLPSGWAVFATR